MSGYYDIRFHATGNTGVVGDETGTSPSTSGDDYQRLTQPSDSSSVRLQDLKPDTTYSAELIPQSNEHVFNTLSVTFKTKPGGVEF